MIFQETENDENKSKFQETENDENKSNNNHNRKPYRKQYHPPR